MTEKTTDRFAPRYRTLWESMESGTRLVMRRPFYFFGLWLCAALPVYLLFFLLTLPAPVWGLYLVWWSKPLFEAGMLAALADEMHRSETPSFSGSLKRMWQKMFHAQIIPNLTWRRFSWRRTLVLPVAVLENARGKDYRRRCRQIGRNTAMQSGWLTFLGVHLEAALTYSIIGVIAAVALNIFSVHWLPFNAQFDSLAATVREFWLWQSEAGQRWLVRITAAVYIFVLALWSPFYVAMGYTLYRQARYNGEAHDLRDELRRLAKRLSGSLRTFAVMLCLAGAPYLFAPAEAFAEKASGSLKLPDKAAVEADRDASTGSAPFSREIVQKNYVWKHSPGANTATPLPKPSLSGLKILGYFISGLLAILVCAYILRRLYLRGKILPDAPEEVLLTWDNTAETLPENLSQTAWNLAQNNPRAALSLLLRGLVAQLSAQDSILPAGMTEREIENLAQKELPALYPFTRTLMHHWIALAYARHPVAAENIRRLCADYRQLFETGTAS